jgi:hypothetical protein
MHYDAKAATVNPRAPKSPPESGSTGPFAMVPMAIMSDPDLSPGAKLLFGVILSLTKGPWARCFASNEALGKMTGLSVTHVRRMLRDLEQRGMISRVVEGNCRLEIKVVWKGIRSVEWVDYQEYLESDWWKERRLRTLKLDRYRCRLCGSAENLNVHHRSYENLGAEPDCDVITLCRDCHAKFHGKEGGAK